MSHLLQNFKSVKLTTWLNRCAIGILVIIVAFTLPSCKKKPVVKPPPTTIPTAAIKYMNISMLSGNQIKINQNSTYQFELITTGLDPYLSMMPLTSPINPDSVVFTFEYQCSAAISSMQIFFAPPTTEERSAKTATIPVSSGWSTFSVDLSSELKQFSWGKTDDFLRLDFGNQSGVTFQIRNIHLRTLNEAEKAAALLREEIIKNNLLLETNLKKYLSTNYGSQVTEVKVAASSVNIKGSYTGEGEFSLCEITPYDQLSQMTKFTNKTALGTPVFSIDIDRFILRNGIKYDRLLSKWVIAKIGTTSDEIVSHARYAGQIIPVQTMPAKRPASKKGLGGYSINRGYQSDLDDLNISSVTVNITLTSLMNTQAGGNTIARAYGDKTFYYNRPQVEELDRTMQAAYSPNIVVAAIILIQKAAHCSDPEIGRLLQHPDYTSEGIYSMPNMTNAESVNCYAAGLDFLANRYCRSDNSFGRIHHWIMHNEVDCGLTWTNMGEKPMTVYLDTYIKSMRMCYNIARSYDENSEVFGSFTHSWAEGVTPRYYSGKEMLKSLGDFSVAEGDFQWGVAFHPYPQNLFEPKTWNDTKATLSMNSPLVTFKNLEVLDIWIKKAENKYMGTIKRTLWLSENGTNSRTYGGQDLKEQAAGFAYAWKKMKSLDGIDAIQWHNWIDNRAEDGLMIGLRRFPDDQAEPGGRKPVWYAYQAAGTSQEDTVFEPYKPVIGILNWSEILQTVSNQ